jgi:membrane fusion protein, multidrug efflux system
MNRNPVLRFYASRVRACSPAILLLAGAVQPACAPQKAQSDERSATAVAPIAVSASPVGEAPMPVTVSLTGTLRPLREARIAASSPGRVLKIGIDRGSVVKKGDMLAELDVSAASLSAAEAQKAAQNAKVQRESAKRDCERAEQLFKSGAISKAELELQKSQCESADLGVEAAGIRAAIGAQAVREGAVRAPFSGIVEVRSTDVGEYLMPGSPVATLVAVDKLRLEVVVPEAQLSRIGLDTAVTFRVAAYPERQFTATVSVIGATVRQATRDVLVEAVVDNADGALKPGMFTTVEITTGEAKMPVVPKSAVLHRGDAAHLFVIVDGRAHERVVKLGPEKGGELAVTRGVALGDRVVFSPPDALRNGAAVTEGK